MSECHRCPHGIPDAIGAKKTIDVDGRKVRVDSARYEDLPCAECTLTNNPNNKGRTHVALHRLTRIQVDPLSTYAAKTNGEGSKEPEQGPIMVDLKDAVAGMAGVLAGFMDLTALQREVVILRLRTEKSLAQIGESLGVPTGTVWDNLRRAEAKVPGLSAVLPKYKAREKKRKGRKKTKK